MFKVSKRQFRLSSLTPARVIAMSFFIIIITGAILLNLKIASKNGESIGFLDALFTATSATCVTGLAIADTYDQWTVFGQIVILVMIEAGGIGTVTIATFFSVLLRRKIGLKSMILASESLNHFTFDGIIHLVKYVMFISLVVQAIGALILSIRFIPLFGIGEGIYKSIYYAISSYCNAGFELNGGGVSFIPYARDYLVIYTIAALILIGGLGFAVWEDLIRFFKNKFKTNLILHTKLVLIMTVILTVFGTIAFMVLEDKNPGTFGSLNFFDRFSQGLFHSISTRTAGIAIFNNDNMTDISKFLSVVYMFIGAAPGSTAGGIKVTTFGILFFTVISLLRGHDQTIILKHKINYITVYKAIATLTLVIFIVFSVTALMLVFEPEIRFINILYEVASATGTVGLSTGITPDLSGISKILLILTMFLGRVGPFSFAMVLAIRSVKDSNTVYPDGKIMVG